MLGIFRGDDTDFKDLRTIYITLPVVPFSLENCYGEFIVCGQTATITPLLVNTQMPIVFTAEQTSKMPLGTFTGVFRIYDANDKVRTIDTSIRVLISDNAEEIYNISQGGNGVVIQVAVDYNGLRNKPKINGREVVGNRIGGYYGLVTSVNGTSPFNNGNVRIPQIESVTGAPDISTDLDVLPTGKIVYDRQFNTVTKKMYILCANGSKFRWMELKNERNSAITFAEITGEPTGNTGLVREFNKKQNTEKIVTENPSTGITGTLPSGYVVGDAQFNKSNQCRFVLCETTGASGETGYQWTKQKAGEQQQQADWNQGNTGAVDFIKNKPTIPAAQVQSDWGQSNTGAVDFIKNKPTIPAAQIQSNWNQSNTGAVDFIKNKPTIPAAQQKANWSATGGITEILNAPHFIDRFDELVNFLRAKYDDTNYTLSSLSTWKICFTHDKWYDLTYEIEPNTWVYPPKASPEEYDVVEGLSFNTTYNIWFFVAYQYISGNWTIVANAETQAKINDLTIKFTSSGLQDFFGYRIPTLTENGKFLTSTGTSIPEYTMYASGYVPDNKKNSLGEVVVLAGASNISVLYSSGYFLSPNKVRSWYSYPLEQNHYYHLRYTGVGTVLVTEMGTRS